MALSNAEKRTTVKCRTCGERILVPTGWSAGPAVRRHYWRKHPDVMNPPRKQVTR
jgi:hypothetical protein